MMIMIKINIPVNPEKRYNFAFYSSFTSAITSFVMISYISFDDDVFPFWNRPELSIMKRSVPFTGPIPEEGVIL